MEKESVLLSKLLCSVLCTRSILTCVWVCFSRLNEDSWFRCYGVDTNRNWAFHWNEGGASGDTCSETYRGTSRLSHSFAIVVVIVTTGSRGVAGPKSFSEPEVTALADYISAQGNVKGYADIHSYSQLWMSVRGPCPTSQFFFTQCRSMLSQQWGWTTAEVPKDYTTQNDLSKRMLARRACPSHKTNSERGFAFDFAFLVAVAAIKATHGKVYGYGPSAKVIYVASGGADDWTYGARNVTWSYSVELRDTGTLTRVWEDSF